MLLLGSSSLATMKVQEVVFEKTYFAIAVDGLYSFINSD
jgi:hypothetical protein